MLSNTIATEKVIAAEATVPGAPVVLFLAALYVWPDAPAVWP